LGQPTHENYFKLQNTSKKNADGHWARTVYAGEGDVSMRGSAYRTLAGEWKLGPPMLPKIPAILAAFGASGGVGGSSSRSSASKSMVPRYL
jgi:hypothetical protein